MTPPNPEDVKFAVEQLRAGGKEWTKQSGVLETASGATADLSMSGLEMGPAAVMRGAYEQIRSDLETILGESKTEATNLGNALQAAARIYQREEDKGVHSMKGVW